MKEGQSMFWKRFACVALILSLIISIIGNVSLFSQRKEMLEEMDNEIFSSLWKVYIFSKEYDRDEKLLPNYEDRSAVYHMLSEIDQYGYARGKTNKYGTLRHMAGIYDKLLDLILNYGKIEPTLILNRVLLSYLEPLMELSNSDKEGRNQFLREMDERIDSESNIEDCQALGYRVTTFESLYYCLSVSADPLYEILEAEGYERLEGR